MAGRPIGATKVEIMDLDILAKAHSYVLFNCSEVDEFRAEHLAMVHHENRRKLKRDIQRLHSETFESWFQDHVEELHARGDHRITESLRNLASDSVDKGWKFVIKPSPRHVYDMDEQTSLDDVETHLQGDSFMCPQHDETMDIELVRGGLDGTVVDNNDLVIPDEEDLVEEAHDFNLLNIWPIVSKIDKST
ncbi:hypothetical protein CTI12_AA251090 [Artemisia annua]|uniref:Uncharacterized protein n=1 Tax=Artemisia annua TaxID=35608 RepID=A0A2U1NL59_ARTAN|nr:hypothetical protein CTI12_AA251090 [Artemisia annua]